MKIINYLIPLIAFLTICYPETAFTQEIWTLEKCVYHAIEKSLQVEGSTLTLESTEIDVNQARHARFPNLSAGTSVGWNFGRTIDPTRNEFITETFFNNSLSLNANVVLFNSNRINNTIKQSEINNKAALKDLEQTKRDISLNVATFYLNILFAKENLINAENQLKLTMEQLAQLNKQIKVGNRPENDRLDLEAQTATNEQSIIEAKNSLNINLLNLKQLLRLDPDYNLDVVAPEGIRIDTDPDLLTFNEVFNTAMKNQPAVASGELNLKSAFLSEKIAAAALLPTIGAGGSLRTNYSNKGLNITGFESTVIEQTVYINGQPVTVGFPQNVPQTEKSPYFNQFSDNLSYGVGISMNIPIYNNNSARGGVQRARLNTERATLNLNQVKESLKITVGQALSDARAAKAKYLASEKTKLAQTNLFNNASKRFEIGSLNAFELTRLKTQLESATINALISKYEYLFRTKVLDFYLGKPIILSKQ